MQTEERIRRFALFVLGPGSSLAEAARFGRDTRQCLGHCAFAPVTAMIFLNFTNVASR